MPMTPGPALSGARVRSLVHDLAASEDRLRGHEAADPRYRRQVLHHQARLIAELRTYHPG